MAKSTGLLPVMVASSDNIGQSAMAALSAEVDGPGPSSSPESKGELLRGPSTTVVGIFVNRFFPGSVAPLARVSKVGLLEGFGGCLPPAPCRPSSHNSRS